MRGLVDGSRGGYVSVFGGGSICVGVGVLVNGYILVCMMDP